jgi:hypothetical protein
MLLNIFTIIIASLLLLPQNSFAIIPQEYLSNPATEELIKGKMYVGWQPANAFTVDYYSKIVTVKFPVTVLDARTSNIKVFRNSKDIVFSPTFDDINLSNIFDLSQSHPSSIVQFITPLPTTCVWNSRTGNVCNSSPTFNFDFAHSFLSTNIGTVYQNGSSNMSSSASMRSATSVGSSSGALSGYLSASVIRNGVDSGDKVFYNINAASDFPAFDPTHPNSTFNRWDAYSPIEWRWSGVCVKPSTAVLVYDCRINPIITALKLDSYDPTFYFGSAYPDQMRADCPALFSRHYSGASTDFIPFLDDHSGESCLSAYPYSQYHNVLSCKGVWYNPVGCDWQGKPWYGYAIDGGSEPCSYNGVSTSQTACSTYQLGNYRYSWNPHPPLVSAALSEVGSGSTSQRLRAYAVKSSLPVDQQLVYKLSFPPIDGLSAKWDGQLSLGSPWFLANSNKYFEGALFDPWGQFSLVYMGARANSTILHFFPRAIYPRSVGDNPLDESAGDFFDGSYLKPGTNSNVVPMFAQQVGLYFGPDVTNLFQSAMETNVSFPLYGQTYTFDLGAMSGLWWAVSRVVTFICSICAIGFVFRTKNTNM